MNENDELGAILSKRQRLAKKDPSGMDRAGGALQGGVSGAATGAQLGSIVPGIGTLAGAIGGGILGAVGGGVAAQPGTGGNAMQAGIGSLGNVAADEDHELHKILMARRAK